MALVKAGADVHCKDNRGCGFWGRILLSLGCPQCRGGRSVHSGWGGAAGVACSAVQVDGAALGVGERPQGDGDGAGQGGRGRELHGHRRVRFLERPFSCRLFVTVRGGRSRPLEGGGAGVAVLVVQVDGTALGVEEGLHGEGDGAGQGGRGCVLQGQRRVRFSGCILVSLRCHTIGADGPSTRGGAAEMPFWLCSRTALHYASSNGLTETAMALVKAGADLHCKDNVGYGFSGRTLGSFVGYSVGADGPSTRSGAAGCLLGCSGIRRCTMRRRTATQRRRWRC
jgi:hypothetical protein